MDYPRTMTHRKAIPPADLVGAMEIAERAGVRYKLVQAWIGRGIFPEPIIRLSMGPVWDWQDVAAWLAIPRPRGRHRKS